MIEGVHKNLALAHEIEYFGKIVAVLFPNGVDNDSIHDLNPSVDSNLHYLLHSLVERTADYLIPEFYIIEIKSIAPLSSIPLSSALLSSASVSDCSLFHDVVLSNVNIVFNNNFYINISDSYDARPSSIDEDFDPSHHAPSQYLQDGYEPNIADLDPAG